MRAPKVKRAQLIVITGTIGLGAVVMASVSCGDKGSRTLSRTETIRVRRQESERAAAVIGATYRSLGQMDSEIFEDLQTRTRTIELIRSARPLIQFTQNGLGFEWLNRQVILITKKAAALLQVTQTGQLNWNIFGVLAGLAVILFVLMRNG